MRFPARRDGRTLLGWLGMLVALGAVLGLAFLPSPYVVERPGPTFDALGETDDGPIVDVPDDLDHDDTSGTLTVLTVSLSGSPDYPLTWIDIAEAYLDGSDAIVPMEWIYAPGETLEESNEESAAEMASSQDAAIAAALIDAGYDVSAEVTITGTVEGSPAVGLLEEGDRIVTVNGEQVYDVASIRTALESVDGPATFVVERDGEELTVEVTPDLSSGAPVVGIYPQSTFEFPIDVDISLPDVGGPSAGLMFSLAIGDRLTPGALTGGAEWAGTGTISVLGEVGAIGGIVQKMHGALESGADWFLAPATNCDEVVGAVPDGLQVVAVETLDDAQAAIETVASGDEDAIEALPTCAAE